MLVTMRSISSSLWLFNWLSHRSNSHYSWHAHLLLESLLGWDFSSPPSILSLYNTSKIDQHFWLKYFAPFTLLDSMTLLPDFAKLTCLSWHHSHKIRCHWNPLPRLRSMAHACSATQKHRLLHLSSMLRPDPSGHTSQRSKMYISHRTNYASSRSASFTGFCCTITLVVVIVVMVIVVVIKRVYYLIKWYS